MADITGITTASARAASILMACWFAFPVFAADDFAAVFDNEFKGVELTLPTAEQMLAKRPMAAEFAAARLPGMPLSAEDLSLLLRMTNPVDAGEPQSEQASIRRRFVKWISQNSHNSDEFKVFSALARTPEEAGMRVNFDVDTEEVRVEYRVGF